MRSLHFHSLLILRPGKAKPGAELWKGQAEFTHCTGTDADLPLSILVYKLMIISILLAKHQWD